MYELQQPFQLSELPIIRTYRAAPAIFIKFAILFFLIALTGMFGSLSYKQHQSVFKFYSIGFAATCVIPLRMVGYFLSIRNSKLIIDSTGVHQTLGRKQTDYLWRDISGTALIEKRGGGGRGPRRVSKQLQIRTVTRDVDDDRANLISGIFGIRAIDLETIIQAGLSRWGGAHLANGPVFGRQFQAAKTD